MNRCSHLILKIEASESKQLVGVGVEAGKGVSSCREIRQHTPTITANAVLFTFISGFLVDSLATKDKYELLLHFLITANTAPV